MLIKDSTSPVLAEYEELESYIATFKEFKISKEANEVRYHGLFTKLKQLLPAGRCLDGKGDDAANFNDDPNSFRR